MARKYTSKDFINQGPKYDFNFIKTANEKLYSLPFMQRLVAIHPFLPHVFWLVPLAIVMFFYGTAGHICMGMLFLYAFYGFFGTPKKQDIKQVQILKPGEEVTPKNEKKVRAYCKDKGFAMALEQHQKNYKKEVERRSRLGQDVKKEPYKTELKKWSAEEWNRLKDTFEQNMLKMYGLEKEKKTE